ncbi:MAG: tetratricopeptide repeat protein [Marinilabiliaceae bacterium]|nr:tetratricopeptide repeat protein [Marinilabiliaceae bacterium]
MRHLITLLIIVALNLSVVYAQKGKVYLAKSNLEEMNDLEGAKKAIEDALGHEKSNNWAFTYIVAGKIYRKLAAEGKDPDGLKKALNYYLKAIELDAKGDEKGKGKGKFKNDLFIDLGLFKNELTSAGVDGFNKEDYTKAIESFESVLTINKTKVLSETEVIDTAIIYNTALAAYNGKKYDIASEYFKRSIDLEYGGGDAVLLLNQVYITTNDSVEMGKNLKNGFEKYPDDSRILTLLINYYMTSNKDTEALDYLNKAIEKNPTNASFYVARGVLFDKSKKYDKAEADYLKSLEINENFFDALFNIGVIYFNEGVEKYKKANEISDLKKFNAAKSDADKSFEKSLPYLEKARTILDADTKAQPNEKMAVYDSLKNLYYRFNNMKKYEEMKKLIEELEQAN